MGWVIDDVRIMILLYADNIWCISSSPEMLQMQLTELNLCLRSAGLTCKPEDRQWAYTHEIHANSQVIVDTTVIKRLAPHEPFKVLGSLICSDGSQIPDCCNCNRISKCWGAFWARKSGAHLYHANGVPP